MKTYYSGNTPVHRCNTKVKLALFAAYSVMLFCVRTWWGLMLASLMLVIVVGLSGIPIRKMCLMLLPVALIASFAIVVNGFALDVDMAAVRASGLGGVSAGVFADLSSIKLIGQFGWYPAGFAQGCYYAMRIVLLMASSFVLCFTTTSVSLTNALRDTLKPLRGLRVPVDDVATVFSLALRFIPVTLEELERVRNAQVSRGALLDVGSVGERLAAWRTVLLPMFVGMLRRADVLAHAMSARCYGVADVSRTSLHPENMTGKSTSVMVVGIALIVAVALAF